MTTYNKDSSNLHTKDSPITHIEVGKVLSDPHFPLGIDKLKVCFPVTKIHAEPQDWASCKQEIGGLKPNAIVGQHWVSLGYHGFSTGVSTKNGQLGWVEFNPSKIVNQDGKLVGITRSIEVLLEVLKETQELFEIYPDTSKFAIARLDLTVDFAPVADMQHLLNLATKATPFRVTKPAIRLHPQTGDIESITYATATTSSVIFYDKSKKEKLKTPTFRIEIQAKKQDLREMGIHSISDLREDIAREVFKKRARRFIDLCTETPKTWLDEIIASKEDRNTLIIIAGYEYAKINGRPLEMKNHQKRQYSKFQKKWPHHMIKDLF